MGNKNNKYYVGDIRSDSLKSLSVGKKGWVVGKFMDKLPQKTEQVEIKYWEFPVGKTDHQTKISDIIEITIILKGRVSGMISGQNVILSSGQYCVISPGTENNLSLNVLEDVVGLTIKAPSDPGAKHLVI